MVQTDISVNRDKEDPAMDRKKGLEELADTIANDSGKEGTREEWRELALTLRYQIDQVEHRLLGRSIMGSLLVGFVVGAVVIALFYRIPIF